MSVPNHPAAPRATPDLRIIPIENAIPHEHHDGQRLDKLVKRLKTEDTLISPPVVATLDDERFVVLDGANRITALARLTYPHCLVQVTPYQLPHTELQTWFHAVTGMQTAELETLLHAIPGLETESLDPMHARAALARRVLVAYYVRPNGRVVTLKGGQTLRDQNRLLNKIVSTYLKVGTLNRTNSQNVEELNVLFPQLAAVIVFPNYKPVEILELASEGARIPPGITRHIIHGRALRIKYPLEALSSPIPLAQKNDTLQEWLRHKLANRQVRYYQEATFIFDE